MRPFRLLCVVVLQFSTLSNGSIQVDENGDHIASIPQLNLDLMAPQPVSFLEATKTELAQNAPLADEFSQVADDQRGDRSKESRFIEWLSANGAVGLQDVEIGEVGNPPHRGIIALRDIAAEEHFVRIPFKMILFGESQVIEEDLGHVFHHDYSIPKPFHYADGSYNAHRRLALWMLFQKAKGAQSFYAPYLDLLPTTFTMLSEYTDHEKADLVGTGILHDVQQRQDRAKDEYEVLFPLITDTFPETFPDKISWEDWHWAKAIVNSRCFGFSHGGMKDVGLVPFADMPNHNNVPVSWSINETAHTFDLVTHQPFKAGTEVFISYGTLDNEHLLYVYGFALPGNQVKIANPCRLEEQGYNVTQSELCVLAKMKGYKTTFRDDLQLLQQGNLGFRKSNAIKLRLEERQSLLEMEDFIVD